MIPTPSLPVGDVILCFFQLAAGQLVTELCLNRRAKLATPICQLDKDIDPVLLGFSNRARGLPTRRNWAATG